MLVHISPNASMVIDFFELRDLVSIKSILDDVIITRLSFLNSKKSDKSDSRFALAYRYLVEADIWSSVSDFICSLYVEYL